jgi:hypothetical protein
LEWWEAPIWDSARRHGISDEAIRHALRNFVAHVSDEEDDSVELFLGPDQAANLIEVGVLDTGEGLAIIHAMRGRLNRFYPPTR